MAGDKLKFPISVLIILIVMSLSLAGATFYLFQKEHSKNLSLQDELEDTKTKHRAAEAKIKDSRNAIAQLESKLEEAKRQLDTLTTDLEQEKAAKEESLARIEQLKIDLEQGKGLRSDLENKFAQAQKDIQNLQANLRELESKKIELDTKIKDLETQAPGGVELGKIVVSPAVNLEGKVLVINKDYNFAVINLGSKDGIEMNSIYSVYRDNKYLGDIKVEKIYDSMSAAGFISDGLNGQINEGDKVVPKP